MSVDVPELFRLWTTNVPSNDICSQLAISRTQLFRLCQRHGLPKRKRIVGPQAECEDVSEEEIAIRAAKIRESWSEKELARRSGNAVQKVEVRNYSFDGRDVVFRY